jgi:hypothetical protein
VWGAAPLVLTTVSIPMLSIYTHRSCSTMWPILLLLLMLLQLRQHSW